MKTVVRHLQLVAIIGALLGAVGRAQTTYEFIGPSGLPSAPNTGVWSSSEHWVSGVPTSSPTTILSFGGASASAYTATNDFPNMFSVGTLTFSSPAPVTIAGNGSNGLAFGDGDNIGLIQQTGAGAVTISTALNFVQDTEVNVASSAGSLTLSGAISGVSGLYDDRRLEKTGFGTLILSGAGSNTLDALFVFEGEVRLGKSSGVAVAGPLVVEEGATVKMLGTGQLDSVDGNVALSGVLDLNGHNTTIGYLSDSKGDASGEIKTGSATLTINQYSSAGFSGLISGSGAVVKAGDELLEFSNASTYTGGTTISAGLLLVTNPTGSATGSGSVLVQANAFLGGYGTIIPGAGKTVTVQGTVIPGLFGDEPLRIGTAGNPTVVTFQSGSTLESEICGCGESGLLEISGQLVLAGGNLSILSGGSLSGTYTLATFDSLIGTFSTVFLDDCEIINPTAPNSFNGSYQLVYGSTSITLAPSAIPEPSTTAALIGLAAMGLVLQRRHQRRQKTRAAV